MLIFKLLNKVSMLLGLTKNKSVYRFLARIFCELHNYSYHQVSYFSTKLEGNTIHPKHRIMNYHQFFVDNINKGDRVLDIGCGNGALTFDLTKKSKKVIGIDFNKRNVEIAREKYYTSNVEYIVGDATNHNFQEEFDVVVLSNVLEHIKDRIKFLKKIKKIATKILIRVPMINRDWITLYKKELGVEWRLDKTHCIEYTLDSFRDELTNAALDLDSFSIKFGEIWAVVK